MHITAVSVAGSLSNAHRVRFSWRSGGESFEGMKKPQAFDLGLLWHPQRGSNPCLHLERAPELLR